jgi:hypothetical protein
MMTTARLVTDDSGSAVALAGCMTPRTRIRMLAGAALALTIPLLSGCQAFGINEHYGADYANVADAKKSWDGAHVPLLVPDDARDIRIAYNTIDEGALLAFTTEGGLTADYCEAGPVEGSPAFEPDWWPTTEIPSDGYVCGDWSVVEVDGEFIAWD